MVMLDKEHYMQELKKEELLNIEGGNIGVNGTLISSLTRGINTLLELGRSLGSAIRRVQEGNMCPLS